MSCCNRFAASGRYGQSSWSPNAKPDRAATLEAQHQHGHDVSVANSYFKPLPGVERALDCAAILREIERLSSGVFRVFRRCHTTQRGMSPLLIVVLLEEHELPLEIARRRCFRYRRSQRAKRLPMTMCSLTSSPMRVCADQTRSQRHRYSLEAAAVKPCLHRRPVQASNAGTLTNAVFIGTTPHHR